MLTYLYVAAGGAIGSVARYAMSTWIAAKVDEVFPWGILVVNITGCVLIGLIAAITGPGGRFAASSETRQFFMVGVCGGYTTFSSFSLQTLTLARDGDIARATANVALSVVLCLAGVWLGSLIGASLNAIRSA